MVQIETLYQYKPLYKPNQLILGTGQTVIVTGWLPKEIVAKHLESHQYAAIGQLYSAARGIDHLIRNLLHNPHVRHVVPLACTNADKNAGATQCLSDFFNFGFEAGLSDTGRECWVIRSAIAGYIDAEILEDTLIKLRQCIDNYPITDSLEQAVKWAKKASLTQIEFPSWGFPQTFPKVENPPTIFPGVLHGHRIEGKTIAETWVKLLHRIHTTGRLRPTGYDGQVQELIDLVAVITDEPTKFYVPDYLPCSSSSVCDYLPQILEDTPHTEGVKYTYGTRLRSWFGQDQIEQVISKLIKEVDSASAVMSLWDVTKDHAGSSPCLNHIWVRVNEGKLSLTATFRSHDMFSGWPLNAFGLRALQQHILNEINIRSSLKLEIGVLIIISQSAHIYDDCFDSVKSTVAEQYKFRPRPDYSDPVGNYLIEWADGEIYVTRTAPGGEAIAWYSSNSPLKLIREIVADAPAISPDHIGYLGLELQKCLQQQETYVQDK